ncbi:MAG: elongation factor 4, partial [Deltaproteobacteria bacterium RIFOXYB12_FULL_58_9]
MNNIRNFCIIAHIDHGKSTLADRLIQACGGVPDREFRDQILDSMDIERERGITIKSNTVSLMYKAKDGIDYQLNLIDTPGHVDFSHEVRRSLMSCEGALLIIDAAQGVEAQTVANLYLAFEYELDIVPVINKIDLPAADPPRVLEQMEADLGLDRDDAVLCSAKKGEGIEEVLEAIVTKLKPPRGDTTSELRALIFDAQYDPYRGVILLVRVFSGSLRSGQIVRLMHSDKEYHIEDVGLLKLKRVKTKELSVGDVGYVIAGIKTVRDIEVGDTITEAANPASEPLAGYKEARSVVFSSLYPMSSDEYAELAKALEKLAINDASLNYTKVSSMALGLGFRCGFLGLLHLEVVQERLEREHDVSLLLSAPTVEYQLTLNDGRVIHVDNPEMFPDPTEIQETREPYIKASILIPEKYLGAVIELCKEHRSAQVGFDYLSVGRVEVK